MGMAYLPRCDDLGRPFGDHRDVFAAIAASLSP
jgi:hypothetical protein